MDVGCGFAGYIQEEQPTVWLPSVVVDTTRSPGHLQPDMYTLFPISPFSCFVVVCLVFATPLRGYLFSFSPIRRTEKQSDRKTKEKDKGRYSPRAGPARPYHPPSPASSLSALAIPEDLHPSGVSSRDSKTAPVASTTWPTVPSGVAPHSPSPPPPQPPDLRDPSPALHEEMVARLPPAANNSLAAALWGPDVLSCIKGPIVAWPDNW